MEDEELQRISSYEIMRRIVCDKHYTGNIIREDVFSDMNQMSSYAKYLTLIQNNVSCVTWDKSGEQLATAKKGFKISIIKNFEQMPLIEPTVENISVPYNGVVQNLKFLKSDTFVLSEKHSSIVKLFSSGTLIQNYKCARSYINCIATLPHNDNIFWSADKHVIRHYDIREKHTCNTMFCENVLLAYPLYPTDFLKKNSKFRNLINVTTEILIDSTIKRMYYRGFHKGIPSHQIFYSMISEHNLFMSANPFYTNYLGVCGIDMLTRIYDMRMLRISKINSEVPLCSVVPCDVFLPKNMWTDENISTSNSVVRWPSKCIKMTWSDNGEKLAVMMLNGVYIFDFKKSHWQKPQHVTYRENNDTFIDGKDYMLNFLYPISMNRDEIKKEIRKYHSLNKNENPENPENPENTENTENPDCENKVLYLSEQKRVKPFVDKAHIFYHNKDYNNALILYKKCLNMVTHKELKKIFYFDIAKIINKVSYVGTCTSEYYALEALKIDPLFEPAIILRIQKYKATEDLYNAFRICFSAFIHFKTKKLENLLLAITKDFYKMLRKNNGKGNPIFSSYEKFGVSNECCHILNDKEISVNIHFHIDELITKLGLEVELDDCEIKNIKSNLLSILHSRSAIHAGVLLSSYPEYVNELIKQSFLLYLDYRAPLDNVLLARFHFIDKRKLFITQTYENNNGASNIYTEYPYLISAIICQNFNPNEQLPPQQPFPLQQPFPPLMQLHEQMQEPTLAQNSIDIDHNRNTNITETGNGNMDFTNNNNYLTLLGTNEGNRSRFRLDYVDESKICWESSKCLPKVIYSHIENKYFQINSTSEDKKLSNHSKKFPSVSQKVSDQISHMNIEEIPEYNMHKMLYENLGDPLWTPKGDFINHIDPLMHFEKNPAELVDIAFLTNDILLIAYDHRVEAVRITDGKELMVHHFVDRVQSIEVHPTKRYIVVFSRDVVLLELARPKESDYTFYDP